MYSNSIKPNQKMSGIVPSGAANDEDSEGSASGGWITWFCDLEGHEFFVEV
jgi:hypothetical protein